jgi:hypothetical protein
MKIIPLHHALFALFCAAALATAQEPPQKAQPAPPTPAAVSGVKGVKEEAAARIKNVEQSTVAPPPNTAQGVNKVDGVNTVNGVKADGRTVVLPPPPTPNAVTPPPPPPPPTRAVRPPVVGTAVNVAVGTVGTSAIRPVTGVTGINAAKLQNLETALAIKSGGPDKDGKGKAAAAELLGAPGPGLKPGPKPDGRAGFQEFQKLPNTGS